MGELYLLLDLEGLTSTPQQPNWSLPSLTALLEATLVF